MASLTAAYLRLQNLTKKFGKIAAVRSLSLDITRGEFLALLGPSGCGKTTTLNLIAGFVYPDSGDIHLEGRTILAEPVFKRDIGIVFQNYALFPHMDVFHNVAFGLRMRHVSQSQVVERVEEVLDLVRLPALADRLPRQLSGGQQQRVALARALVIRPRILLLDEPLSNLDARLREEMRNEIREIQKRVGITTIFVTHDVQEAFAMADRVAVMRDGIVQQVGTPRSIYEEPGSEFVAHFVGNANVLKGTVARIQADVAEVTIPDLPGMFKAKSAGLQVQEATTLVVRPEDIHVTPPDVLHAGNRVAGTIRRTAMLGASSLIWVRVGASELVVMSHDRRFRELRPGDAVVLSWRVEDGTCIR